MRLGWTGYHEAEPVVPNVLGSGVPEGYGKSVKDSMEGYVLIPYVVQRSLQQCLGEWQEAGM
jgi:hypothetical protein